MRSTHAAHLRPGPRGRFIAATLLALLAGSGAAWAAQQTQVRVSLKDTDGKPVVGHQILLTRCDDSGKLLAAAPVSAKTTKRGSALFPFLPYNAQGGGKWALSLGESKYFVRHFTYESRQLTSGEGGRGTLMQKEDSDAVPGQALPPLVAKPGGTVEISLTLALLSEWKGRSPATAADRTENEEEAPAEPAKPPEEKPLDAARRLAALGSLTEAETILKTLKQTDDGVEVDFELARVYHLAEREEEEKQALAAVIARDPTYPRANYELGRMAYQNGDLGGAITLFEAEVRGNPGDTETAQALAALYIEGGRTEDAIRTYEKIVASEPGNTDALVSLDGLYTSLGETEKSSAAYAKILASSPEGADLVYYRVGRSLSQKHELGDADRGRAAGAFRKAIELNPKNGKAHRDLAYLLIGMGQLEDAKKHFQAYLEIEPDAGDAGEIREFLKGI